jgi:solute carrier family 13 (sodium-dependent dicarboxylate transporter), member 2/3/5
MAGWPREQVAEPFRGIPAPVAAALPVTLFFATAIITRDDVNSLDWDVLMLIAGGLALGYTLQVTGLDPRFAGLVPIDAADWVHLGALAAATLTLGTFFSNTAIAATFVPVAVVAATVSTSISVTAFVMVTAFVASLSMALPMSTPPNAIAYSTGELTSRDFISTAGIIGTAGAALAVGLALVWVRL